MDSSGGNIEDDMRKTVLAEDRRLNMKKIIVGGLFLILWMWAWSSYLAAATTTFGDFVHNSPEILTPSGNDQIPIVRGASSNKITFDNLRGVITKYVSAYPSLTAALVDVSGQNISIVCDVSTQLTSSTTIISGTTLIANAGCMIGAGTLTFNTGSDFKAGNTQVFNNTVVTGLPSVRPQWFGGTTGIAAGTSANDAALAAITHICNSQGYATVIMPDGIYPTKNDWLINTDTCKLTLKSEAMYNSYIWHTGAAVDSSGAIVFYSNNPYFSTPYYYPRNSSIFDIHDISIGSKNSNTLYFKDSGFNGRLDRLWLYAAGTATNTAYLHSEGGLNVTEISNIRYGAGNMGDSSSNYQHPSWTALFAAGASASLPPHAVYMHNTSTNHTGGTEVHFRNNQSHAQTTSHAVKIINDSSPASGMSNITFDDCQFKVDGVNGTSTSSYWFEHVNAQLTSCYSENSAPGSAYPRFLTMTGGQVDLIGSQGANSIIYVNDASGAASAGSVLTIVGGFYRGITVNGSDKNYTYKIGPKPFLDVASSVLTNYEDYEEGTWATALDASSVMLAASGTITLNAAYKRGAFTRIGRQVTVTGRFVVDSVSSPSGNLTIAGLPYTVATGEVYDTAVAVYAKVLGASGTTTMVGSILNGTSVIIIEHFTAGATGVAAADIKANSEITVNATYFK